MTTTYNIGSNQDIGAKLPLFDAISKDSFTNAKVINLTGLNEACAQNTEEDIVDQGGTLNLFTSASKVQISSSSANDTSGGSGAEKVIIYGIDDDYDLAYEELVLNGTTKVESTGSYWFIYKAVVTQSNNGSNDALNVGNITVVITGTSNAVCQITTGYNISHMAAFMVPRNYICLYKHDRAMVNDSSGACDVYIRLWVRPFGKPFNMSFTGSIHLDTVNGGISDINRNFYFGGPVFDEKSIIKLSAETKRATTASVSAGFTLVLLPKVE